MFRAVLTEKLPLLWEVRIGQGQVHLNDVFVWTGNGRNTFRYLRVFSDRLFFCSLLFLIALFSSASTDRLIQPGKMEGGCRDGVK